MSNGFKFSLQPALDAALNEREELERAVLAARKAKDEARRQIEKTASEIEQTSQQLDQAHDNLNTTGDTIARIRQGTASMQLHKKRIEMLQARRLEEQDALQWARDKLKIHEDSLKEADSKVQSLERLRERHYQEYLAEQERRQEAERDEQAIQNWAQRQPPPNAE